MLYKYLHPQESLQLLPSPCGCSFSHLAAAAYLVAFGQTRAGPGVGAHGPPGQSAVGSSNTEEVTGLWLWPSHSACWLASLVSPTPTPSCPWAICQELWTPGLAHEVPDS